MSPCQPALLKTYSPAAAAGLQLTTTPVSEFDALEDADADGDGDPDGAGDGDGDKVDLMPKGSRHKASKFYANCM